MRRFEGATPGSMIGNVIASAILEAALLGEEVGFEFNGVEVVVAGDSDPGLVYRDWDRALQGFIEKHVGPHPKAQLSAEELRSDAAIRATSEAKQAQRRAEYAAREKLKRDAVEATLTNAGPMEFSDAAAWNEFKAKNVDPYGGAVVTYAERWARLMQMELASGRALEDIAAPTSSDADLEGITGFMYGCAVGALAHCWKHGEALRRWHNLKTQIGSEGERANQSGGVLNPALLSIGGKD